MTRQRRRNGELSELTSSEPLRRVGALARIADKAEASPAEIEAIIECLGAAQKVVQRRAAETLVRLEGAGITVRAQLSGVLRSDAPRSRWGAAYALSLIGPPPVEARPALFESLGSDDGDIRWAAVEILLRTPDWHSATFDLSDLLVRGNPAQRKMAAYALRGLKCREPNVQAALTEALFDVDVGVRLAAVSALLHLATDRDAATESARRLLSDPEIGVRRATAALLGELGTPGRETIEALQQASTSDDESLRRAAKSSLGKLKGEVDLE